MKKILIAIALYVLAGCSADVEQLREEQDSRVNKEGKAVVLADFKQKYDASPSDPKTAYLYGRLADGAERQRVAEKLAKDSPEFPWAHLLLRSSLQERGQYEEALVELKKAAELAPSSKTIKASLATESTLAVIESTPIGEVAERLVKAVSKSTDEIEGAARRIDSQLALLEKGDMDAIAPGFKTPPTRLSGADLLVLHTGRSNSAEDLFLRLYVRNSSSTTFVLKGEDVQRDAVGACFTADGRRVGPSPESAFRSDKGQCRACRRTDISIPPGAMGRPHLYFPGDPEKFERCVLFNIPAPGSTILVKLTK